MLVHPMTDQFAPSEENTLYCDARPCTAAVSMVNGVPREDHGWGRLTLYEDPGKDYDLCPWHLKKITEVLGQ